MLCQNSHSGANSKFYIISNLSTVNVNKNEGSNANVAHKMEPQDNTPFLCLIFFLPVSINLNSWIIQYVIINTHRNLVKCIEPCYSISTTCLISLESLSLYLQFNFHYEKFSTIMKFFCKLLLHRLAELHQILLGSSSDNEDQKSKIFDPPNCSRITCHRIWWWAHQNECEIISPQRFGLLTPTMVCLIRTMT